MTREYNEADKKVSVSEGAQEGGKTDANGNFYIDERPVRCCCGPARRLRSASESDFLTKLVAVAASEHWPSCSTRCLC